MPGVLIMTLMRKSINKDRLQMPERFCFHQTGISLLFGCCMFVLLFSLNHRALSQSSDLGDVGISLLTCDPGDELYSVFGHSAIRVWHPDRSFDVVYNYGTFDFNTPGFLMKFLRGKLPYMLSRSSYEQFLYAYNAEKRGIFEQELLLTPEEKRDMVHFLEWNLLPENRFYPYDFFFDNCATRIRDVIPHVTQRMVKWSGEKTTKSFRDLLHEYLPGKPWTEFGIDLVIGAKADQTASVNDQMFLPDYLYEHFEKATLVGSMGAGEPLTKEAYQVLIFDEDRVKRLQTPFFTPHILFILCILLEIFLVYSYGKSNWRVRYDNLFYAFLGLASVVMMFLWFVTDHQATGQNWNLIWCSPLFFLLLLPKKYTHHKQYVLLILLTGCFLGLINIFLNYLPQVFNSYKTLIILLAIIKLTRGYMPFLKSEKTVQVNTLTTH
ncbi:MAG TPA: DUF4105 domain-containing protein [Saprospiraceae bacterium]|mgnify:CR=1 FL=1|nr:DUF4105 domain-containing protein [Saprospiraceae bacterium]